MMPMIKMMFGEDILRKVHSNHMDMISRLEKCMIKTSTLVVFSLRITIGNIVYQKMLDFASYVNALVKHMGGVSCIHNQAQEK